MRCQNLTSVDVSFWRLTSIPALLVLKVTVTLSMFWQRISHEAWLHSLLYTWHAAALQYIYKNTLLLQSLTQQWSSSLRAHNTSQFICVIHFNTRAVTQHERWWVCVELTNHRPTLGPLKTHIKCQSHFVMSTRCWSNTGTTSTKPVFFKCI